ncbi:hypothetical protein FRC01_010706, partial [Tulasnella sp. 417]
MAEEVKPNDPRWARVWQLEVFIDQERSKGDRANIDRIDEWKKEAGALRHAITHPKHPEKASPTDDDELMDDELQVLPGSDNPLQKRYNELRRLVGQEISKNGLAKANRSLLDPWYAEMAILKKVIDASKA